MHAQTRTHMYVRAHTHTTYTYRVYVSNAPGKVCKLISNMVKHAQKYILTNETYILQGHVKSTFFYICETFRILLKRKHT
jgi:hypothetical protein